MTEKNAQHFQLEAQANSNAIDALASLTGLSRQRIKRGMNRGAVWLESNGKTKRIRRAKKSLPTGSTLHFYYNPVVLDAEPPQARLIADEGDYSVWHKPRGMLSQGSKWGDHCAIARWVEQHHLPQRPGFIVHRLDRAASGLMLVAHSKRAARLLSQLFEQRALEKEYRAICHGIPQVTESRIDTPLDGRHCISHYRVINRDEGRAELSVTIETGRKHQIRRHLAGIGHPLVGDRLYGPGNDDLDLQLTSYRLTFQCPINDEKRNYTLPETLLPSLSRQASE